MTVACNCKIAYITINMRARDYLRKIAKKTLLWSIKMLQWL